MPVRYHHQFPLIKRHTFVAYRIMPPRRSHDTRYDTRFVGEYKFADVTMSFDGELTTTALCPVNCGAAQEINAIGVTRMQR